MMFFISLAAAIAVIGFTVIVITRRTLGRARTGGFVLVMVGSMLLGSSYTYGAGKFDGVSLWCTLVAFSMPYWLYVRERTHGI